MKMQLGEQEKQLGKGQLQRSSLVRWLKDLKESPQGTTSRQQRDGVNERSVLAPVAKNKGGIRISMDHGSRVHKQHPENSTRSLKLQPDRVRSRVIK